MTLPTLSAASLASFFDPGRAKRNALAGLREGADIPPSRVAAQEGLTIAHRDAAAFRLALGE